MESKAQSQHIMATTSEHLRADDVFAHKAGEQSTLYRFTDRLYHARTLREVYEAALDAIGEALGCSRASVLRFDRAGVMRFVAWRGLSEAYRHAIDGHSPWRLGDRDAQPICVSDIASADEPEALKKTVLAEGIRALAFVPLAIEDKVIGKFMVYYDVAHIFTDHERELALTIARQLGFAIERNLAERESRRFAALVESSSDAIISKDLDGIITSWNSGAERLFGYTAAEVIRKPVTILIPSDRHDEEPSILARTRAGECIEPYETLRQRKDGSFVYISLAVSPIRDANGDIMGASKIARDVTDRRRAREQRQLLLREMNHRIKNLFALTNSIVHLSAPGAATPVALASIVSDRLSALARAHSLTISAGLLDGADDQRATTLHALIKAILAPYSESADGSGQRFSISGPDATLAGAAVTPVALLLHEFATNAAKYGSLSTPAGRIEITCRTHGPGIVITWREINGPKVQRPDDDGFGSRLVDATVAQVGRLSRDWQPDGLVIELTLERDRIDA